MFDATFNAMFDRHKIFGFACCVGMGIVIAHLLNAMSEEYAIGWNTISASLYGGILGGGFALVAFSTTCYRTLAGCWSFALVWYLGMHLINFEMGYASVFLSIDVFTHTIFAGLLLGLAAYLSGMLSGRYFAQQPSKDRKKERIPAFLSAMVATTALAVSTAVPLTLYWGIPFHFSGLLINCMGGLIIAEIALQLGPACQRLTNWLGYYSH